MRLITLIILVFVCFPMRGTLNAQLERPILRQESGEFSHSDIAQKIVQLQIQYALKAKLLGDSHPEIRALKSEIETWTEIFAQDKDDEKKRFFTIKKEIEDSIKSLKSEYEEKSRMLGHAHPEVKALELQIEHWTQFYEQRLAQQESWVNLFNGKDLTGWTQKNGTAKYEVVDGTIQGTTVEGSPNSFLCSDMDYSDFELVFEVKVHNQLNSGVQIRSRGKEKATGNKKNDQARRVYGPQVEIESSGKTGAEAGYIYGEATGRGWLTPKERLKPHKHFIDGEWNTFRVFAEGPRIRTWINGNPIEDLTDEKIFETHPRGFIGLQVHGLGKNKKGPFTVQWRNIEIREIIQNENSKKSDF